MKLLHPFFYKLKTTTLIIIPNKKEMKKIIEKNKTINDHLLLQKNECQSHREQYVLHKGQILELTVERRNLLTSITVNAKEHEQNIILATNNGRKESENIRRN